MSATADRFQERPVSLGVGLAVAFAVLAAFALVGAPVALVVAFVGGLALGAGAFRARTALVALGVVTQLTAVLAAALGGVGTELLVVATAASVLAWDTARQAIDLGAMVGRDARAHRALLVHVSGVLAAITLASGLGYVVFRVAGGGRPMTALVLLLFGGLVIAVLLRRP